MTVLTISDIALMSRSDAENAISSRVQTAYLGDHMTLARVLGAPKLYLDTRDEGFAGHVMLDGFWEMWLTLFCARNVKPGMHAIDVGANFGYYSLLLGLIAGPAGRVTAVEPNPHAAWLCAKTLRLNGCNNSQVLRQALGAEADGYATLFVPEHEPKNATLVGDGATFAGGLSIAVSATSIDALRGRDLPTIDFVKIDAEGSEEAIVQGMESTLGHDKPLVVIEFNAARYADAGAFLERLRGLFPLVEEIDYDGHARPVTTASLLQGRHGEDRLLALSHRPTS